MTNKLKKALIVQKKSTEQVNQQIPGLLGIPLDGQRRVEVSGRNAFVYVRLRNNTSEVIQAYNNKVAIVYNLPVLVHRVGGRYEIVGVDTQRYDNNWSSFAPFLPRHGNTHSLPDDLSGGGGGDVAWIYGRQFMPALVFPSGSVGAGDVIMSSYTLKNDDGSWRYVGPTGTQSLTVYNPATGTQAVMALVYLDSVSGNPQVIVGSGTYFSNTITGSSQIAPYIPSLINPAHIPLAAVRLVTGTFRIGWDNIYDVRQWIHVTPTGSTGGQGGTTIGLGAMVQDEGAPLATGTTFNFVGAGVDVSMSGSVARVHISGSIPRDAFQGFGYNYYVNSELSGVSGTVYVFMKTLAGTDPSPTNPLVFRIGNTVRTVTSAIGFSLTTGTNWFNAGSSELAGQDIDYFAYVIWEENQSAVRFGISRIPFAVTMADFVNTPTDEKYIFSNVSAYNSSDEVENIGRMRLNKASTNGAWLNQDPTISRPIYQTDPLTWTPVLVGFSANPTYVAQYQVVNNNLLLGFSGIGDGTSNTGAFAMTSPFKARNLTNYFQYSALPWLRDSGSPVNAPGTVWATPNTNLLTLRKSGMSAWTASGTKNGAFNISVDIGT